LLADQSVGHFLEDGLFGWTRVATESGFDRIEVFHQQVAECGAGGENRIGSEHLRLIDHFDLRVSLLLRLGELVRLIESGVFDVVFAKRDAGNAEEADFHSLCLDAYRPMVKVASERPARFSSYAMSVGVGLR